MDGTKPTHGNLLSNFQIPHTDDQHPINRLPLWLDLDLVLILVHPSPIRCLVSCLWPEYACIPAHVLLLYDWLLLVLGLHQPAWGLGLGLAAESHFR
jgi:hypothetical protein